MSWPRPELGGAGDGKGKADWGRFYTHVHVNEQKEVGGLSGWFVFLGTERGKSCQTYNEGKVKGCAVVRIGYVLRQMSPEF